MLNKCTRKYYFGVEHLETCNFAPQVAYGKVQSGQERKEVIWQRLPILTKPRGLPEPNAYGRHESHHSTTTPSGRGSLTTFGVFSQSKHLVCSPYIYPLFPLHHAWKASSSGFRRPSHQRVSCRNQANNWPNVCCLWRYSLRL